MTSYRESADPEELAAWIADRRSVDAHHPHSDDPDAWGFSWRRTADEFRAGIALGYRYRLVVEDPEPDPEPEPEGTDLIDRRSEYWTYLGSWDDWSGTFDALPACARAAIAHLYGQHADGQWFPCPICEDRITPSPSVPVDAPEGLPEDAVPCPWFDGAWFVPGDAAVIDGWHRWYGGADMWASWMAAENLAAIVVRPPVPQEPETERVPLLNQDGTPHVVGRTLPGEDEAIGFLQWSDGRHWKWDVSHGGAYRWRRLPLNDDGTVTVLAASSVPESEG